MSDIKLTAYIDGMAINIDRDLLPKDEIGRPYEYIIDEKDEFGKYKRDEKYYNKKSIEDQKKEIEEWFEEEVKKINKNYHPLEIEIFSILEHEARLYKSCSTYIDKTGNSIAPTPYINYILTHDNKYKGFIKENLIDIIISKADNRKHEMMRVIIERRNKLRELNIV